MKLSKRIIQVACAAALAGTVASPAAAGTCTSNDRNFISGVGVELACKHIGGAMQSSAYALVTSVGAAKTFSIHFISGLQGLPMKIIGLNSSGQPLANCTFTDSTPDNVAVTGRCDAAVMWRAVLYYPS
jgi:hypothetical protein